MDLRCQKTRRTKKEVVASKLLKKKKCFGFFDLQGKVSEGKQ